MEEFAINYLAESFISDPLLKPKIILLKELKNKNDVKKSTIKSVINEIIDYIDYVILLFLDEIFKKKDSIQTRESLESVSPVGSIIAKLDPNSTKKVLLELLTIKDSAEQEVEEQINILLKLRSSNISQLTKLTITDEDLKGFKPLFSPIPKLSFLNLSGESEGQEQSDISSWDKIVNLIVLKKP